VSVSLVIGLLPLTVLDVSCDRDGFLPGTEVYDKREPTVGDVTVVLPWP
jgi:hypothetical protein